MRGLLVGTMVGVVAMVGTAFGGSIDDDSDLRAMRKERVEATSRADVASDYRFNESPPFEDIVQEDTNNAGKEFGLAIGSSVLSILYHPIRMVTGIVGAELGGVVGWTTGGDQRAAHGIWRPLVEGDYFIRPDQLDRTERYQFGDYQRVPRAQHALRGPVVGTYIDTSASSIEPEAPNVAGESEDPPILY
jgi:hypothetical protein